MFGFKPLVAEVFVDGVLFCTFRYVRRSIVQFSIRVTTNYMRQRSLFVRALRIITNEERQTIDNDRRTMREAISRVRATILPRVRRVVFPRRDTTANNGRHILRTNWFNGRHHFRIPRNYFTIIDGSIKGNFSNTLLGRLVNVSGVRTRLPHRATTRNKFATAKRTGRRRVLFVIRRTVMRLLCTNRKSLLSRGFLHYVNDLHRRRVRATRHQGPNHLYIARRFKTRQIMRHIRRTLRHKRVLCIRHHHTWMKMRTT